MKKLLCLTLAAFVLALTPAVQAGTAPDGQRQKSKSSALTHAQVKHAKQKAKQHVKKKAAKKIARNHKARAERKAV